MKNIKKTVFAIWIILLISCSTTQNLSEDQKVNKSVKSSTQNIDNSQRDGSSFQKAIIVKSISAEYEYVRDICPNCKVLGQSLVYDNGKPFDILRVKKPDGEEVSYYFDISKFFGKGFD